MKREKNNVINKMISYLSNVGKENCLKSTFMVIYPMLTNAKNGIERPFLKRSETP